MRFRLSLVAFASLLFPVSGMLAVEACGQTSDMNDAGPDAAPDHTTADVAPDVAQEAEAGCMNDANLTQLIPEGGLDVDAGGIPLGACVGCFEGKCSSQIMMCNTDCSCRQGVLDTITCVEMTGDFQTCGTNAILNGDGQLAALFSCAAMNCLSTCQPGGPGDASTDAPDGG